MNTTQKFEAGQRVITPQGEGEILTAGSLNIEVRLNTGEVRSYTSDQLSDDSDAGQENHLSITMPEGPSIAILREAVQAFSGKKIKVASGNSKKVNFEDLTGKKILRLDRVSIVRIHHAARILK